MGGTTFTHAAVGKTADEAFANARSQAQYDHGHGGYTGTIAEKDDFVMIPLPPGDEDADSKAYALINADDPRVSDKWGPAGCFALGGGRYLFFGWASC